MVGMFKAGAATPPRGRVKCAGKYDQAIAPICFSANLHEYKVVRTFTYRFSLSTRQAQFRQYLPHRPVWIGRAGHLPPNYQMARAIDVVFNIRRAKVTAKVGEIVLALGSWMF